MQNNGEAPGAPTGIPMRGNGDHPVRNNAQDPMGNHGETHDDSAETRDNAEVTPWNGTALRT
ncbi:hypothetical protein ABZX90_32115 [Streptomyces sp. NPDC002935]|uniref:hypothetical protein n=1 Tax=Streptomyces sp. NPDC002935 TaxID=3154545 RepID=UPI0033BAB3FC